MNPAWFDEPPQPRRAGAHSQAGRADHKFGSYRDQTRVPGVPEQWHEPGSHEPPRMARTQIAHEPLTNPHRENELPRLVTNVWGSEGISQVLADTRRLTQGG